MARQSMIEKVSDRMAFAATFMSKAAEQICWPLGSPTSHTVGAGVTAKVVPVWAPTIHFHGHTFMTDDKSIARGLVEADQFGRSWGWHLDPASLPEEFREVYGKCNRSGKIEVALSAFEGVSIATVLKNLEESDYEPIPEPDAAVPVDISLNCPVPGCGLTFASKTEGSFDKVQKAIVEHVRIMHPAWTGTA